MSTVKEISAARKVEHNAITKAYYIDKTMSKPEFDALHTTLDTRHDVTKASDYIESESEPTLDERIRAVLKSEGLIA